MAEFFGVALLVIFGAGAGASVVTAANQGVSSSPKGVRSHDVLKWIERLIHVDDVVQDFLSINFGWAVGECDSSQLWFRGFQ